MSSIFSNYWFWTNLGVLCTAICLTAQKTQYRYSFWQYFQFGVLVTGVVALIEVLIARSW